MLGVACAVVVVTGALIWPREREPVYQGRSLSEWIGRYYRLEYRGQVPPPEEGNQAKEAVLHIGTNGVPSLVEWVRCERDGRSRTRHLLGVTTRLPRAVRDSSFVCWLD